MPKQQLKFSFIFIGLGVILGWFSHSAFNSIDSENNSVKILPVINESPKNKIVNKTKPLTLEVDSQIENSKKYFIELLDNGKFEEALLWYKDAGSNHEIYLLPILLTEVVSLTEQSDSNAIKLLDIFLQEYYSNSSILVSKANALISFDQIPQAFNAFFLAKNYAKNDQDYNQINQLIHEHSFQIYERYKLKNKWHTSIKLFSMLVEYEPQFSFYHLALAESHLNVEEKGAAILHLQLILEDTTFGNQASEMLEMLLLPDNSNHITLEVEGEHYIVETLLADEYKVKLMIDTGASYSSLSSYTIAQLVNDNLAQKIGQKQVYTAGGKVLVDIYKLKKMSLGYFSVSDIIVAELNLDSSLDGNNVLDGLLGVDFLNHFDFSVDQKNKQLILAPKK